MKTHKNSSYETYIAGLRSPGVTTPISARLGYGQGQVYIKNRMRKRYMPAKAGKIYLNCFLISPKVRICILSCV